MVESRPEGLGVNEFPAERCRVKPAEEESRRSEQRYQRGGGELRVGSRR